MTAHSLPRKGEYREKALAKTIRQLEKDMQEHARNLEFEAAAAAREARRLLLRPPLQYIQARGIPCFGIEPTASTAKAAREVGIETHELFFGRNSALELTVSRGRSNLIIANNVLAHVPDINDFVAGLATALAPGGTITLEFPHLLQLVAQRQFDTVYHEHFSYLSFHTTQHILAAHGLRIWDVEELPTHGGPAH